MRRLALIAAVVSTVLSAPAQAAFSTPEEVAPVSAFHRGFAAAADASGRLTVATRTPDRAARLIERRPGGRWSDLPPARGIASGVYKTSLAAAGDGALGVAWWVVQRRDTAINVAVRDPGGALSDPIEIAGAGADGVDHPAIAVDAAGDVLLAYQTGTAASHERLRGAIAIAYRPAGRSSFIGPMVVDSVPSNPPVVSLARDGTGIVAWTRRSALMAVSVGSRGTIGVARRIARPVLVNRPVLAAGPRSAASVAYRVNASYERGTRILQHTSVRVFARPAGGTFGQAQRVFRSPRSGYDLALAADERGRATLAWTDLPSARRDQLGPGRVWAATGRVGGRFGRSRVVEPRGDVRQGKVSVAARHGHVALAWDVAKGDNRRGVEAAAGRWNEPLKPQLITSSRMPVGPVAVAIAGNGRASAFWTPLTFACQFCEGDAGQLLVSDGP